EMGHARALLALKGKDQSQAAEQVVERGLNVRETEALVRKFQEQSKDKPAKPAEDPNVRRLQLDLSEKIGARVTIHQGSKGKGKLQIEYNSLDELEGILAHIR
ncbi:MAG: chromosome partitioning protein ParB, partial [Chromatiales bacterium]|nr:chromosome partitioning protein ParB [Chromatiales bacterium]